MTVPRLSLTHCVLGLLLPLLLAAAVDIPSTSVPRHLAPLFNATAVINEKFEQISLSQYLKLGKWVVLLFYPYDFTFVCPTEIQAFSENHGAFAEVGAQVLAISTDSHHTHLAWIRTAREDGGLGPIAIPLVADTSKQISRRYGVLVEDSDDPMFGAALRGLFIIGPDGRIRSLQMNDDQVGRNWQEALRIIKGFQWASEHDEVCPASWTQPGDSTLKATPDGIKDFYRKQSASSSPRPAAASSKTASHADL